MNQNATNLSSKSNILLSDPDKSDYLKGNDLDCLVNSANLQKYTGPWGIAEATHLLRRTTFGNTPEQIREASTTSLDAVILQLLEDKPLPAEPVKFTDEIFDPNVATGESWINKPFQSDNPDILRYRNQSLGAWTLGNLLNEGIHIREKMTLFWNNHFVTQPSVLKDPNLIYFNNNLLRINALGNFRDLVKMVTINPAMLRYLNGNQNSQQAPNENYARELMELFTIGKGDLAGSGDYTTFTEHDVSEVAKILTGWRDEGYFYRDGISPGSRFIPFRHDRTTKQLSHRFDNATIANNNEEEYKDLIDVILDREEVSKFMCRNFYRWFVFYDITEEVEKNVIEPLAVIFRENDYEIKPVIKALLSSQHFYEICSVGPMIKNPIDFAVNLLVHFEIPIPEDISEAYRVQFRFLNQLGEFGMKYYEPPNVAGWKAYYQEPLYYRTWITSVTLPMRQGFTNAIVSGDIRIGDNIFTMDVLKYIAKFNDPFDPNALIDEFVSNLFPQSITEDQRNYLKEILIPGLPDFEWTVEYGMYINSPNDEAIKRSVEVKLRSFLTALLNMPEYYLS